MANHSAQNAVDQMERLNVTAISRLSAARKVNADFVPFRQHGSTCDFMTPDNSITTGERETTQTFRTYSIIANAGA